MTIATAKNTPRNTYTASAGQTNFTIGFEFFQVADVKVFKNGTQLTYHADPTTHADRYKIVGATSTSDEAYEFGSGGTVVLGSTGASANDKIVIIRDITIERTQDFPLVGAFDITSLNTQLDTLTSMMAEQDTLNSRSIRLADTDIDSATMTLPDKATRLNKVLSFDSNGNVESTINSGGLATLSSITSDITTVAGIASNVTTVAGIGATSINNVSSVATEVGLLGNASTIADMALLGNADVIADMALLATTDVIADLNTLATTDIVNDLNQLATTDFVSDLNAVEGVKANVTTVANNITGLNSFAERYRVGSADPSSSLDSGDLNFNTTSNELKYYDGNQWQTVASQDQNVKVTANDTSAGILNTKIGVAGGLTKTVTNSGGNEVLTLTAQAAEVYGFEIVDIATNPTLRVTTTNGGADNISSTDYANFDDVIYGASGMTWSLQANGDLRVTI